MKNVIQGSLITTFRCNAQCNMCNIWKFQTNPNEEIDASYYEKLPAGLRINITGGEPTLRKDIDKIFEILYPKSRLLELSTNGYNTQKIVELANKYPNILIRVSVEGLPKINDAKRGIKDGFDHALRTMLELKKTKCKNIGFSVVISPDNYMDLLHLYDLCVALDVELGNSAVHNSWYFHKEDNQIESEEALRQHELFVKALLTSKRRHFKDRLKDYGRVTHGAMSPPATAVARSGNWATSRKIPLKTSWPVIKPRQRWRKCATASATVPLLSPSVMTWCVAPGCPSCGLSRTSGARLRVRTSAGTSAF